MISLNVTVLYAVTYKRGGEVECAGRRVNGADTEFDDDLCQHLTSHCYTPVFDTVVHRCQLCTTVAIAATVKSYRVAQQ